MPAFQHPSDALASDSHNNGISRFGSRFELSTAERGVELAFDVQPFRKYCLVNGYDDIGLTLRHADKIRAFEAERLARQPWLANRPT